MAQILIRLKLPPPQITRSPVLQERTGKRPGMIVYVADDSHEWGTEELGPKFGIFKLPGAPLDRVASLMLPELTDAFEEPDYNILTNRIQKSKRNRRWEFLIDEAEITNPNIRKDLRDLPYVRIKTESVASGRYTWNEIKGYFLDHQTGEREKRVY